MRVRVCLLAILLGVGAPQVWAQVSGDQSGYSIPHRDRNAQKNPKSGTSASGTDNQAKGSGARTGGTQTSSGQTNKSFGSERAAHGGNTFVGARGTSATAGRAGMAAMSPGKGAAAPAGKSGGAGAKSGGASAGAPAGTGQVKEVTKSFLEAIKTRKVEYSEAELAGKPGVIILGPRKFVAEKSACEKSGVAVRNSK